MNSARLASQAALVVRNPLASARDAKTRVRSLGGEDPLEEETATHSSILAWKIPRTEEAGRLQLMRSPGKHQALNEHMLNKVIKWFNGIPFS